jgi:hypothetical protein
MTRTTSSPSPPRFTLSRRSILGGVVLALVLLHVTRADAVTVNSQPAPGVTSTPNDADGSLDQTALHAQDRDTITFDIPASDPGHNDRASTIGLTSGQLAIDKSVTLDGPPVSLLMLKRNRYAPLYASIYVDSDRPIAIEDLTASELFYFPTSLALLMGGATALLSLPVVLFYRHLQRPTGKRIRFGILWDAYEPICGKCENLLQVFNDYSFRCPFCQVELGARGENGRTISPHEALARIRRREYW